MCMYLHCTVRIRLLYAFNRCFDLCAVYSLFVPLDGTLRSGFAWLQQNDETWQWRLTDRNLAFRAIRL